MQKDEGKEIYKRARVLADYWEAANNSYESQKDPNVRKRHLACQANLKLAETGDHPEQLALESCSPYDICDSEIVDPPPVLRRLCVTENYAQPA